MQRRLRSVWLAGGYTGRAAEMFCDCSMPAMNRGWRWRWVGLMFEARRNFCPALNGTAILTYEK